MNIKERITYLLQKYDQPYREQKRTMGLDFPYQEELANTYVRSKQLYLDDFDAALA